MIDLDKKILESLTSLGLVEPEYDGVTRIPTGSLSLDFVLGGGLPRGRITTIIGPPSFGKTTLALIVASTIVQSTAMRNGGKVAFYDMEHTFDYPWAAQLGIQPDKLMLFHPDTGEQAMEGIGQLVENALCDLIIVDSVAETKFTAEAEGSFADMHVGLAARRWSQFCRKIKADLDASGVALLMINQVRYKIGLSFGDPRTEFGGEALKFAASIRIEMLKPQQTELSIIFRYKSDKNKTANTFGRKGETELIRNVPQPFVSVVHEIVELGKELGVFTREDGKSISSGGYWYFKGEKLALGAPQMRKLLMDDRNLRMATEQTIRDIISQSTYIDWKGNHDGEDELSGDD